MATYSPHYASGSTPSYPFPSYPSNQAAPWSATPADVDAYSTALYDSNTAQKKLVETLAQRRQRVDFLRRREWTRRIAEWLEHSATADAKDIAPITHSWVDILAAADAVDDYDEMTANPYTPEEPSYPEPYIIYTASPRPGPAPSMDTNTPNQKHTQAPSHDLSRAAPRRQRSFRQPRSRHSSLSSISEEDEAHHWF
ncbi:uncharacterized protein LAESUDRAFT_716305 [Laetiporus sulphureus 93-53]|uniref:Uncharacterized protein n=1 Tax=Laetiporus sulphureus 93-53 TaxID=1314785 RepID=A0A165CRG1_9APHY|nr:uncharacterized protein LAESUDRAFT_716305 [Laetiporus sulphureus 93-53]KZT03294.1 hypothetical protein LAESUDRAFT_716305 [Laetiporus sulphureus 93-53]